MAASTLMSITWCWLMIAACCALTACSTPTTTTTAGCINITIGGELFCLEAATDDATRARGLSGRTSIDEHGGMIFIFPYASMQSFFMPDCPIAIDIAFLDGRGRVTAIHTMPPEPPRGPNERADVPWQNKAYHERLPTYSSIRPAQFAIELRAGSFQRLGVKVGDRIELDLNTLKAMAGPVDQSR